MQFLPELTLLGSSLVIFILSLAEPDAKILRNSILGLGAIVVIATLMSLGAEGELFFGSYRVDLYSQLFKCLMSGAMFFVLIFGKGMKGITAKVQPEYYLFLFISVLGLMMLVSSVELLAIFVALELSSFAVYLMVPLRNEAGNGRIQMEAGIKYLLFRSHCHRIYAFWHELYLRAHRHDLSAPDCR